MDLWLRLKTHAINSIIYLHHYHRPIHSKRLRLTHTYALFLSNRTIKPDAPSIRIDRIFTTRPTCLPLMAPSVCANPKMFGRMNQQQKIQIKNAHVIEESEDHRLWAINVSQEHWLKIEMMPFEIFNRQFIVPQKNVIKNTTKHCRLYSHILSL